MKNEELRMKNFMSCLIMKNSFCPVTPGIVEGAGCVKMQSNYHFVIRKRRIS